MDKLKVFESFVSVATKGSLSAAARAEGVAPAIIGRRLDALESHLGVKLLLRTTRRISLTHEGSAFLENCQRLLSDVANAVFIPCFRKVFKKSNKPKAGFRCAL